MVTEIAPYLCVNQKEQISKYNLLYKKNYNEWMEQTNNPIRYGYKTNCYIKYKTMYLF